MVKTKQILIALAVIGANVLHHMPVHKAFAVEGYNYWYGTTGGFVHTLPDPAVVSGVNLTIDDNTCNTDDIPKKASSVLNSIYGGYTNGNDTVSNNSLTIALSSSIPVAANIYAGYSTGGEASENKLIINSGTIDSDVSGGWSGDSGKVSENKLSINNVTIEGNVYGGQTNGVASKNEVTIKNSTIAGKVYGGCGVSGEVSENKLSINNVTIEGDVYGGRTNGAASKNEVTIKNSTITGEVYGGYGQGGEHANRNEVTINSGTINGNSKNVYGGRSVGGQANYNKVTITGGTIDGNGKKVYGGYSNGSFVVNNKVTITGGTINANVYGGYTIGSGYAFGNEVTIKNGTISGEVYGGIGGTSGQANDNKVTINGGIFKDAKLYGGSGSTTSTDNTLNLNVVINGTISEVAKFQKVNFTIPSGMDRELPMLKVTTSMVLDGVTFDVQNWSDGDYITLVKNVNDASFTPPENFYVLTIGLTKELVYANGTPTAKADYTIKQGSKKYDSAATAGTYPTAVKGNTTAGGLSATSYSGNEIIIRRGTYSGQVRGAYADSDNNVTGNKVVIYDGTFSSYIHGGRTTNGNAENNSVTIKGGTFNCEIYGGETSTGNATNNTVTIEGGTFTSGSYKLYGGYKNSGMSSGNTLNLKIKMGGKASEVKYFQNMNFTLPSNITNGDIMLETASVTYDNTTIGVTAANGVKLNKDDKIYLVKTDAKGGAVANLNTTVLGGAAKVESEGIHLILTLLQDFEQKASEPPKGGSEDQQKAPVEGVAAAAVIVNASADLASGEGMASLVANTAGGATDTFGAMSAGSSKYKTGSHVDVDGWGVIVGAGKTKDWKNGSATTYGLFFEYGKGDFDTYNGNVHGDGNSENKGVGIMARHKLTNNTYYEGNIRFGKQETEWSQSELGGYETDSRYYGISVGVGHIYPVGKNEIDVYGRYTYGHVGACDATLKDGSNYNFESVKSHRVRVGGKYNFKVKDSNAKPYVGLAWEHEFKGEARASISGVGEAPAPSMKGNTGIMEVGCDWKVSKKWTVGLGANAYMGKRKGWDGMARVFYNF